MLTPGELKYCLATASQISQCMFLKYPKFHKFRKEVPHVPLVPGSAKYCLASSYYMPDKIDSGFTGETFVLHLNIFLT